MSLKHCENCLELHDNCSCDEDCEMPTPCMHCKKIFDLNDGYGSDKWYPDIVICEKCHKEEEDEIERDNEIDCINNELEDAYFTIKDCTERAKRIGYELENNPKEFNP